ncbi:hypothetical protein DFH06DRAFT_1152062 [Mycena polygramma]|nr:hypothetical protein DFH06DRAFT_1152062 [Mycena polygramma]
MCDTIPSVESSLLLSESLMALVPGAIWRDTGIVLGSASLAIFVARHQGPARKFNMLKASIGVAEETLQRAKTMPTSASSHADIIDAEFRFLQVKLSASKIQYRMLEMHDESWKVYFKGFKALLLAIRHSAAEVREIQTALLIFVWGQLIIEEEHQRKLSEGIKESREVLSTVVRSPAGRAYLASRRSDSGIDSFQV